jgi:hypothetical protein
MTGFLVFRRRIFGEVSLGEDKPRGIVSLLGKIEPGDAGLFDTGAGIFDGHFAKRFDLVRLYVDVDVDD